MSGVCPGCGVAVVPGYVRCPKCRAALPHAAGRAIAAGEPGGGTAMAHRGVPLAPVLTAIGVAAAVIVGFGVLGGDREPEVSAVEPARPIEATPLEPRPPAVGAPAPGPAAPQPAAQDPGAAAAAVEDVLRRERLWGRVQLSGSQIDVRSGSCNDAAMMPAIDGKVTMLRDAGLTRLRCLAQSGAVVFERNL